MVTRPARRGTLKVPAHCHPLTQFVFTEMNRQRVSMGELAERVGCERHSIGNWRFCRNPRLDLLVAAMNALGFELTPVPMERDQ
jgi:DNA-binding phage protein